MDLRQKKASRSLVNKEKGGVSFRVLVISGGLSFRYNQVENSWGKKVSRTPTALETSLARELANKRGPDPLSPR